MKHSKELVRCAAVFVRYYPHRMDHQCDELGLAAQKIKDYRDTLPGDPHLFDVAASILMHAWFDDNQGENK